MAERRVKTFDEVMKKIKKDNYAEFRETCESLKDMEKLRVDAIIEMIKFDEDFKITNKSKKVTKVEDNGLLIYKCDKPSYLEESIEKHFDTVRIEASASDWSRDRFPRTQAADEEPSLLQHQV